MKLFKISLFIFFLTLGITVAAGYFWLKNTSPKQIVLNVGKTIGVSQEDQTNLERVMGFDRPKTYLVLFLNNTELRPGGGFIGAYAVMRVDKGTPEIIKIEGSEGLDNNATTFADNPPEPISRWIKVKHWYFRDSNWSPDFAISAKRALEIYRQENGVAAVDIDAVIGFTPTVIEQLLEIIGPITAEGIEFSAQNFTEKLEYEVEYGYKNRGEEFGNRKNLLEDVASALIAKTQENILLRLQKYLTLSKKMLAEKQIAVYAVDAVNQKLLRSLNLTGEMRAVEGDYVMWVDANLGALKTDAAIIRSLEYKIVTTTAGYLAGATMNYNHTGKFDWRTSRYLSYSRVFVPIGSKLIKVVGAAAQDSQGDLPIGQGVENGRQWFGAYINIAPGTKAVLTFEYLLPEAVVKQAVNGQYNLLVQKQIGTNNIGLTAEIFFKKAQSDLSVDREFNIKINN